MISDRKHGWCNFKLGDFENYYKYKRDRKKS